MERTKRCHGERVHADRVRVATPRLAHQQTRRGARAVAAAQQQARTPLASSDCHLVPSLRQQRLVIFLLLLLVVVVVLTTVISLLPRRARPNTEASTQRRQTCRVVGSVLALSQPKDVAHLEGRRIERLHAQLDRKAIDQTSAEGA